jgi:hypothetical protein
MRKTHIGSTSTFILLTPDPLSGGVGQEIDPLAQNAGDVDTSMPLLVPEKLYNMHCAKVESKTNDAGVGMIRIILKTTKDEMDTANNVVNKGFPIFENFIYTPTGNLTIEQIKKSGAVILKAFGLATTQIRDFVNNPKMIEDKIVCVKIKTRKEKDGYPASSNVGSWIEVK